MEIRKLDSFMPIYFDIDYTKCLCGKREKKDKKIKIKTSILKNNDFT